MSNIYYESMIDEERNEYIKEMRENLEIKKLLFMLESVEKTLEIAREDAEIKVLTECGTEDDLVKLYIEAEEEANKKKDGIVRKIVERIKKMIKRITDRIDEIVASISDHMSGEYAVSRKLLQWGDMLVKIGKGDLINIDIKSIGDETATKYKKEFYDMSQISVDVYSLGTNNYNTISGNEYRRLLTEIKTLEIAYNKKLNTIFTDRKKITPEYGFGSDYSEVVLGYHSQVLRFLQLYGTASTKPDARFVRIITKDKNIIGKHKDKKIVKQARKADVEI